MLLFDTIITKKFCIGDQNAMNAWLSHARTCLLRHGPQTTDEQLWIIFHPKTGGLQRIMRTNLFQSVFCLWLWLFVCFFVCTMFVWQYDCRCICFSFFYLSLKTFCRFDQGTAPYATSHVLLPVCLWVCLSVFLSIFLVGSVTSRLSVGRSVGRSKGGKVSWSVGWLHG